MKIVRGDCGHIKARWDNYNCLRCSSCSRLSTCSTCSTWSEETWILDKRSKSLQENHWWQGRDRRRKKRLLSLQIYLMIIQLMGALPLSAILPGVGPIKVAATRMQNASKVLVHQSPVTSERSTRHQSTSQRSASHWSTRYRAVFHRSTRHWATSHQLPVIQSLVIKSPGISHWSTSHQLLVTGHQAPVITH